MDHQKRQLIQQVFCCSLNTLNQAFFLNKGKIEEQGIAREILTNPESDRLRTFLSRLNTQVTTNS